MSTDQPPRRPRGRPRKAALAPGVAPLAGPLPDSTAARLREAGPDAVQRAIDNWQDKGDAVPPPDAIDPGATARVAAPAADPVPRDPKFDQLYSRARDRSLGYLQRRQDTAGRGTLMPPGCEIHPKLGIWAFNYCGRWMAIRWVSIGQKLRQRRHQQGWQYFEGAEWCDRLGLVAETYLNERGRIQTGDTELAWMPIEYVERYHRDIAAAQRDVVRTAAEKFQSHADGRYIPRIHVMEGSDDDVGRELDARRNWAERRT